MKNDKKEISWRKERSLTWLIMIYPDNDKHMKAFDFIKQNYSEYSFVKHRPEIDEKKEHIHVVVRFKNYRWNTALSEELEIEINMLEKCRSLDNALLYLTHFRYPEKIQYTIEDIDGTLKSRVQRLLQSDGKDSTDRACDLVNWINSQKEFISMNQLFAFANANGLYGELVRGISIFREIVHEHNSALDYEVYY